MQKEVQKAQEFGVEKLVKELFSVADTLDICLQNRPDFESPQFKDNNHAKQAFQGIEATKKQLQHIFRDAYDIEEFNPLIGDVFSPQYHNAIVEVDPKELEGAVPPGRIGRVFKSGWKRNDTLLRAANVGVVKKAPQQDNTTADQNTHTEQQGDHQETTTNTASDLKP